MTKHFIMWDWQEQLSASERVKIGRKIKRELEALVGNIEGLVSLEIILEPLPTSTCDIALISEFVSADALKFYTTHPLHVAAAQTVRANTRNRKCVDFEQSL